MRLYNNVAVLSPCSFDYCLPVIVFPDEDPEAHRGCFVLWKDDKDNKVYVYSDAALLPQDFEIVDAESQRQPEA
jgi:hypothetical protein